MGVCSANISQGMLLKEQSSNWWLETSWRSSGVTVITTPFRYCKWLCLQWESVDVSLVQVMAYRLFGAKPLPGPVEGPVIWNVMTAMLRHCNNNGTKRDFGITNDYIFNESVEVCFIISQDILLIEAARELVCTNCEMRWPQGPHNGACGIRMRVLFEMLSLLCLF